MKTSTFNSMMLTAAKNSQAKTPEQQSPLLMMISQDSFAGALQDKSKHLDLNQK